MLYRDLGHLAMNTGRAQRRPPQRQPFDQCHLLIGHRPPAAVRACPAGQADQSALAVAGQPPLRGAQRYPGLACGLGQRNSVFQVRAQHLIPGHRLFTLRLG
jgi:hypothetical protein